LRLSPLLRKSSHQRQSYQYKMFPACRGRSSDAQHQRERNTANQSKFWLPGSHSHSVQFFWTSKCHCQSILCVRMKMGERDKLRYQYYLRNSIPSPEDRTPQLGTETFYEIPL